MKPTIALIAILGLGGCAEALQTLAVVGNVSANLSQVSREQFELFTDRTEAAKAAGCDTGLLAVALCDVADAE